MSSDNLVLSVIIPNYNYQNYVGQAIESALAVDWPDVEVIVVDDGSTDGSRAVIESFGSRITALFQENSGQVIAYNLGYAHSRGDVVIFLDSDDMLHPSIMREFARVWRPGVSKVQFQMKTVDANGMPLGSVFPQFHVVPTPQMLRRWVQTAAAHPTPPGSGNAYSRWFLERLFPLDKAHGYAGDSCVIAAAPLLGDVITVAKPLVSYRMHGKNDGAISTLNVLQFRRPLLQAQERWAYSRQVARSVGLNLPDQGFRRSLSVMQYRAASFRLFRSQHPIEGDTTARLLSDVLTAAMTPQGRGTKEALAITVWVFMVLISPLPVARKIISWKYTPGTRPGALRLLLSRLGVVR